MGNDETKTQKIEYLLDVMRILRDPLRGCPWDKEQNFASVVPYTIEEAYEVEEAIRKEDFDEFKEKNNLFIIINYDKKVVKVFIKGIISEKKIIKNLKFEIIDDQESSSFDKILIKLKKEIFELIKSQNIIDIRTPSFLNVSLIASITTEDSTLNNLDKIPK